MVKKKNFFLFNKNYFNFSYVSSICCDVVAADCCGSSISILVSVVVAVVDELPWLLSSVKE